MASDASPYIGPRPFERNAEDRARFFGRDREVLEIVSLIVSHPLVLVYAQSGAGKTSLFNAAVTEELERTGIAVLPPARVGGGVAPQVPAAELSNLYVFAALQSMEPGSDERDLAGLTLTDFLARDRGEAQPRTLVLDQFEELFTSQLVYELYGDDWQRQQQVFFDEVARAVADDPLLRVVFLMRKEYLAELEPFTGRLPERLQTRFHLEPLDGSAALAAVEGPLAQTERTFDDGVAETLVDKLLAMRVGPDRDIRGRFVEPVQLQLVCRSLWQDLPPEAKVITEGDVRAFGDVDTVLGQFYDRAIRAAASAAHMREPKLRAELEDDFITSIGTRGTVYLDRRWRRRSTALDELERRHVIHAEWRAGTRWLELTHDRLIDPIRRSNERVRTRRLRRRVAFASIVIPVLAAAVVVAALSGGSSREELPPVVQEGADILGSALVGKSVSATAAAALAAAGPSQSLALPQQDPGAARTADDLAYDAQGRLALLVRGGSVEEWNPSSGRKVGTMPRTGERPVLAVAPEGDLAAVGAGDRVKVFVFDPSIPRRVSSVGEYRLDDDVTALAFDPHGLGLAVGVEPGRITFLQRDGRRRAFGGDLTSVRALAFSRDGSLLASGTGSGLQLWDAVRRSVLATIPVEAGVTRVSFSPDGRLLVTVDGRGTADVWRWKTLNGLDLKNPAKLAAFQRKHGLEPNGQLGRLTREAVRRVALLTPIGAAGAIRAASFTPDGTRITTASPDGTLTRWGPFAEGASLRERIVGCARGAVSGAKRIQYNSGGRRMEGVRARIRLPFVPPFMDSSSFVTWCYWLAGASDPNGFGYNGVGYTGTMLATMTPIARDDVQPGDVVIWKPPATGQHVAIVVSTGKDPLLVSHGSDRGPREDPRLVRFSEEHRLLASNGHGKVVWLSATGRRRSGSPTATVR